MPVAALGAGLALDKDKNTMNAPVDVRQLIPIHPIDISKSGGWAQFATLARAMRTSPQRWALISLPVGSVLVIGAIAAGQVRLNAWQGAFYDALQQHDLGTFLHQLAVFMVIVAVLLSLVVAQTWLTEVFKVRLRGWLTRDLLGEWLRPKRAYLFTFAGEIAVNPDQRIHEDARHLTELSADLGNGLVQASLLLVSFIGVLWGLSAQVIFNVDGNEFSIPGYMVWCALAYASAGSWLTWRVGRPLIPLNTDHYAREAELRFALVRVADHAESVALYQGEADERSVLDNILGAVLSISRRLAGGLARLTWVTSGYGWLVIVAPFVMAAPGYFSGRLTLGALMIVVGAFTQIQGSLRWFVDNFARIADWRATLMRVVAMREALRSVESLNAGEARITLAEHPEGKLSLEKVEAYLPGSLAECAILDEKDVEIGAGEYVLVTGETAAGKATFFLALAGLWPWGKGTIRLPPRDDMMFLPQQPYLPLGTLRATICYPAAPTSFGEPAMLAALSRVGLERLADSLDREARWDKDLSLDEQQSLAFARVLLHVPKWVLFNDALSALDRTQRKSVMEAFGRELAGTTVISAGRGNLEEGFYTKTLHLRRCPRT
ncbi:putative ATP-binding cassette transporter [Rhizobiales bacterium GAS113]|nr:putative ATP-binding cassette transporter [Rhizobiales bacterium GAS113]